MKEQIKILIVDDNRDNLDVMKILLESKNYIVHSALNGKEALQLLYKDNYNLIISDILMPVMDGFQLCRECKKNENLRNTCFVFYTATYIDSKDEEFSLSLGAQRFIRKPQEPEAFLNIIKEVIEKDKNFKAEPPVIKEENEKEILKLYSERLVAKLEKKNLDLEKEIESHKKTFKELIEAKEKAEESDKLKTAFLANMSHEIRTPMNGIIGFTNLLKNHNLSGKEQDKYIDIIHASGKRLINLIEDLINISKIETGQMELTVSEFDLRDDIENIYNYYKSEADNKGLRISILYSSSVNSLNIKTDRDKFNSILSNLINNAIKYTEKGLIEIKCEKQNNNFEFYIKDTGIGIPIERQGAIFERFVQADISDIMAKQGAGLGLTITKAYVDMLGGKICMESGLNKGSVFHLTLPQDLKFEEKEYLTRTATILKKTGDKHKLKILIAEDDEVSSLYLKLILENFSNELFFVKNGREAVEYCINDKNIDLILMDVKMPELSGYHAVERIRKFNKDVVIVAQTAYGLSGDKEKFMSVGCNDYLSKPINEDDLVKIIKRFFTNNIHSEYKSFKYKKEP